MAAGNIKGITIEFRGDTTSLDKALRQVKKETKDIDSELKKVNQNLKFDPKNVELLKQKAGLLKQKIDVTKQSLEAMKKAQAEMDAKGVDKTSKEYQELRRQIIETESKVKTFNQQLKETQAKASGLGQLGAKFSEMGGKIKSAGQALAPFSAAAAAVLGSLGAMGLKAATAADDILTLSQQTGISTDELQLYAAAADLVDVSVETMAKSQQKLKKNMLSASEGGKIAERFEQLGISVTDANGELRDSNDVFQETIKALGEMENETERDAVAMEIFGKSASQLNPLIEDAGATYEKVAQMLEENGLSPLSEEELQNAQDFKDSLDTLKLIFGQLIQIIGGKVATVLQPLMDKVVAFAQKVAGWLANVDGEVLTKILAVTAAIAALAPVLMAVGTAVSAVGAAMSFLAANPITLIIAAIAAVIAIIVLLIKHWDEVKAKATEVWEHIKTTFGKVADFFAGLWDTIKGTFVKFAVAIGDAISGAVKGAINGVIGYIENTINKAIRLINSAIGLINKIPGVSIGQLGELSLPRLAKGGVLYGAQTVIAGEAGPEAIIPLDKLFAQMDRMADRIAGSGGESAVTINVYTAAGTDLNELARQIEARIVASQNRRRLAWQ